VPNHDRAAGAIKIALRERERFADPQPGTPQHDDHAAQPHPLLAVARSAHHRDDLFNCWRVRRIQEAFVAWRATLVKAGQGRRRATPAGAIQQRDRFRDVLLWTTIDKPACSHRPT
jgi:hypothetical protein